MTSHKKAILSILSVLLLISSVIPTMQLYLNSADGHAYLRRKFNEALPYEFSGSINFKQARLAMFSGFLAFDSLSMRDNRNMLFATIPLVVAKFSFFNILKPNTSIDSLIMIGPQCHIKSEHIKNIWKLKIDSLIHPKPNLAINSFIVRYGDFSYSDQLNKLFITSKCHDIYSEFDFPANYYFINLKNTKTDLRYTFLNKTVITDYLTVKVINNRLYLSDGKISCEGLDLQIVGSIDRLFTEPYIHLNIQTAINSRTFFKNLKSFENDKGETNTKLLLNGTLSKPDFHATLKHGRGVFGGVPFDSLNAEVSYINNFLTIKRASLNSQSGKIKISGLLDFYKVFAGHLFSENPNYNALQYTIRADGDDVLRLFTKDSLFSVLPLKGYVNWRGNGVIPQFMTGLIESELYTKSKDTTFAGDNYYLKIKSELSVSAGKIKLQKNEVRHNGSFLKGSGEYNLFTGIFDFNFKGKAGLLPPQRVFKHDKFITSLRIKGNRKKSELYANLVGIKGNSFGGVDKVKFKGTVKTNGQVSINQAEIHADKAFCKLNGYISAPYFFADNHTNAALKAEIFISDLNQWWNESQLKGSVYGYLNLNKKNSDVNVNFNLGATNMNIDNNHSNLVVEGSLKGDYNNLIGDFEGDLIRNNQNSSTTIKIGGSIHGRDLFMQSISVPAVDSRIVPYKNLQYELNFVDIFLKKLNNATDQKFIFHGKSR